MENDQQLATSQQPSVSSDPSTNSNSTKQSTKSKLSLIYNLQWFPMTTSPWIASVAFLFQIVYVINLLDFYSDMSKAVFQLDSSKTNFNIITQYITENFASIAYVLNTFISILSILALLFNKSQEQEGYSYVLCWIGSKIFPVLRYLIDINLAIAAIFMIRSPLVSIFFAIAAAINLIISFLCQNYTLRKDYLCCKSMPYMMLWKLTVIIGYALNCSGYYLIQSSRSGLLIYLSLQFILSFCLLICYFLFGYLIYRHISTQIALLFILNIFFSITAGNLYDGILSVSNGQFVQNRNIQIGGFFFIFNGLLIYSVLTNLKKKYSLLQAKDPIKKIYFLFHRLQNSSENINDDCQIRGIIRYHLSYPCKNPNCFNKKQQTGFYDAKKNKFSYPEKLNQGKTSFTKFIAKCIYEQELQNYKWDNTDLLIDYIQLFYLKLKNLYKVTILLSGIENKFLTPFQKLRLTRLRRVMKQENKQLNQQLYNGQLDIQNLIASEKKFDEIKIQLKQVLQKNIQFWRYIQNYTINLSTMFKMLNPNFILIDKINNNWKFIAKYFQIQKVWKFLYVFYTLYFRNQKLKPQLVQQFGQSVHEDEIFATESQHIDKTTQSNKLYASKMIFQQDVCCVHINHSQQKPIIKSVSRYFERMFGYKNSQILQSSLQIMMPPCIQQLHRTKFIKWAGQGMSNKENNYQVKKVFPKNKDGYIVSAFKFYKQYLKLNKQLEYVGMFKKNREEQYVMILNNNYQIEGITESLVERLGLSIQLYNDLLGINLLIFLPGLINYTKFQEQKNNFNYSFLDAFVSMHKNITTLQFSQKSKTRKELISSKKYFTKSNMLFVMPQLFQFIKQTYTANRSTTNKESIKSLLTRINEGCKVLHECQYKRKFKVEIEIRMIQIQQGRQFFQFYIRQIEHANKNKDGNPNFSSLIKKKSMQTFEHKQQQDINHFFQNSHNSQSISLSFTENIFIKQQNNQPVQMISYVEQISLYVRIIFVIFFGLLIGSLLFQYNNYDSYKSHSQKTYAIVDLQLKMFMLDSKYDSILLGITGTKIDVEYLTNYLRQIRQSNVQYKKSILNININQPRNYTIYENNAMVIYDQIDIIDKAFEAIIQILYTEKGNPTIGSSSYQSYQQLLLPYLQQLTTTSMNNISKLFDTIYKRILIKNYIYISTGVIFLIVGFLFVLSRLIRISRSFVSLMEIFTQFSQVDLKKVIRYCLYMQQLFAHLNRKYDSLKDKQNLAKQQTQLKDLQHNSSSYGHSSLRATSPGFQEDGIVNDQKQDIDNANLNKKVKKIQNGKQLQNLKLRSIVYLIVFLFLYGMASFGLNLYTSLINDEVNLYNDAGNSIFRYYSAFNIYYLSMKDKALLKQKFDTVRYQTYINRVAQMKKLKYEDRSGISFKYMKLLNQIIFGNICTLYPDVIIAKGYSIQDCQNIANNNLQHGVQSFLFYMSSNVDFYLSSTSYQINPDLIRQMEIGMQICNLYLNYLLQRWMEQFISMMNTLEIDIIIICSGLFMFQVIIYIMLIEVFIVGNLKDKFLFFRKIYNNMMPDFIITKQKIIKAKLQVEGFIAK